MEFSRCMPQRQRSPIKRAPTCPLPNCWATSAGAVAPAASLTSARTTAPGLISPTRLSVWNGVIPASRCRSSSSVFRSRTHGCSQPSRVSTRRYSCFVLARLGPIQIDGQQLADRRAVVLAAGERIGAAQHQQPAPALAHEIPQERELVRREKAGLEIVEHDRVITVQLVGRLGKAVSQLHAVELFPQPDQDRLVGPLGRFRVGMIEPVEQRAGRLGALAAKVELGLAPGDAHQADELDLFVFLEGPAQELELPVGASAHVEHPVRPAPLIDDDQPAVVGERLLARSSYRRRPACSACLLVRGGERTDLIEVHALCARGETGTESSAVCRLRSRASAGVRLPCRPRRRRRRRSACLANPTVGRRPG